LFRQITRPLKYAVKGFCISALASFFSCGFAFDRSSHSFHRC
jgi:hypothetical protein